MYNYTDAIIAVLLILNLMLLGSSLLRSCIRLAAFQGMVVGLLPLLEHSGSPIWRVAMISSASIILKGFVYPWILVRTLRDVQVRRELEPMVGYGLSIGWGVIALIISIGLMKSLVPAAGDGATSFQAAAGLTTVLVGLFLMISRRTAIIQVLGYIVLENGIYTMGIALVPGVPMLVELGALLDVFIAVFIMNIATYHISREFDHIDVDRLDKLKG